MPQLAENFKIHSLSPKIDNWYSSENFSLPLAGFWARSHVRLFVFCRLAISLFVFREIGEFLTSSLLLRQVTWRRSSSQAHPSGQKAKEVGRRWKTRRRRRRHILNPDFLGKASSSRVIFTTGNSRPCLWSDAEQQKSFRFTHWPPRKKMARSRWTGFLNLSNLMAFHWRGQPSSIQHGGRGRTEGGERERYRTGSQRAQLLERTTIYIYTLNFAGSNTVQILNIRIYAKKHFVTLTGDHRSRGAFKMQAAIDTLQCFAVRECTSEYMQKTCIL